MCIACKGLLQTGAGEIHHCCTHEPASRWSTKPQNGNGPLCKPEDGDAHHRTQWLGGVFVACITSQTASSEYPAMQRGVGGYDGFG